MQLSIYADIFRFDFVSLEPPSSLWENTQKHSFLFQWNYEFHQLNYLYALFQKAHKEYFNWGICYSVNHGSSYKTIPFCLGQLSQNDKIFYTSMWYFIF